jgi:hypothetical protein
MVVHDHPAPETRTFTSPSSTRAFGCDGDVLKYSPINAGVSRRIGDDVPQKTPSGAYNA